MAYALRLKQASHTIDMPRNSQQVCALENPAPRGPQPTQEPHAVQHAWSPPKFTASGSRSIVDQLTGLRGPSHCSAVSFDCQNLLLQAGCKSVWERLGNEAFIAGMLTFDRCTPAKLEGHLLCFTLLMPLVSWKLSAVITWAHRDDLCTVTWGREASKQNHGWCTGRTAVLRCTVTIKRAGSAEQPLHPLHHAVSMAAYQGVHSKANRLQWLQVCLVACAFMAGQYPLWLHLQSASGSTVSCFQGQHSSSPRGLWGWVTSWDSCHMFDADYMVLWGARQDPGGIHMPSAACTPGHQLPGRLDSRQHSPDAYTSCTPLLKVPRPA